MNFPPIWTVGAPGVQGAGVTGVHGPGVRTPAAAAVNEAVAGLAGLLQVPKGMMLANGLLSITVAASWFSTMTGGPIGMTTSCAGVRPMVQVIWAPMQTGVAIDGV